MLFLFLPPQLYRKQKTPLMGELLDKLSAAEAFDKRPVKDANRPLVDGIVQDLSSMAEKVQATVARLRSPGMPLDIIRKWTQQAPLQALGVAFLVGVILAQPRQ